MESITGINPTDLNNTEIIKMNEKIDSIIQRELLKMYSDENYLEYRFLSRFYTKVSDHVGSHFKK